MQAKIPEQIFIDDLQLFCNSCEFEQFYSGKCEPKSAGINIPGMDLSGRSIDVFICAKCGYVHWFMSAQTAEIKSTPVGPETPAGKIPVEADQPDLSEPSECMSCGRTIPQGVDRCIYCGWTYKETLKEE